MGSWLPKQMTPQYSGVFCANDHKRVNCFTRVGESKSGGILRDCEQSRAGVANTLYFVRTEAKSLRPWREFGNSESADSETKYLVIRDRLPVGSWLPKQKHGTCKRRVFVLYLELSTSWGCYIFLHKLYLYEGFFRLSALFAIFYKKI